MASNVKSFMQVHKKSVIIYDKSCNHATVRGLKCLTYTAFCHVDVATACFRRATTPFEWYGWIVYGKYTERL